uniref:Uncharacterized protein n=1 Tax=Acrobeloides nanus TaxID=290746 RepID=A0A914DY58_9BILA
MKWKISQNFVVQKYNKKFDEYVDIDEHEYESILILDGERFEVRLMEDGKEEEVDNFEVNKMAPQQKTIDMQQGYFKIINEKKLPAFKAVMWINYYQALLQPHFKILLHIHQIVMTMMFQ